MRVRVPRRGPNARPRGAWPRSARLASRASGSSRPPPHVPGDEFCRLARPRRPSLCSLPAPLPLGLSHCERPTRFGRLETFPTEFFDQICFHMIGYAPWTTSDRKTTTLKNSKNRPNPLLPHHPPTQLSRPKNGHDPLSRARPSLPSLAPDAGASARRVCGLRMARWAHRGRPRGRPAHTGGAMESELRAAGHRSGQPGRFTLIPGSQNISARRRRRLGGVRSAVRAHSGVR